MKMKRIVFALVVMLFALAVSAAESAGAFLDRVAGRLKSAPRLLAAYVLTTDGVSQSGNLTVEGNMFVLDSGELASWYDGKTQWTYSAQTGETTVTEPTAEEVAQVNPFAIIAAFRRNYNASFLPSASGVKKVKLTAKARGSDISTVVVTVSEKSLDPSEIVLTMASNQVILIRIKSLRNVAKLPASTFRYDPKSYPGVEVIDLR